MLSDIRFLQQAACVSSWFSSVILQTAVLIWLAKRAKQDKSIPSEILLPFFPLSRKRDENCHPCGCRSYVFSPCRILSERRPKVAWRCLSLVVPLYWSSLLFSWDEDRSCSSSRWSFAKGHGEHWSIEVVKNAYLVLRCITKRYKKGGSLFILSMSFSPHSVFISTSSLLAFTCCPSPSLRNNDCQNHLACDRLGFYHCHLVCFTNRNKCAIAQTSLLI